MLESLPYGQVTDNFSRMLASVKSPVSFPCQNMLPEYYIKFDWIAISPANKIMCGSLNFLQPQQRFLRFALPEKSRKHSPVSGTANSRCSATSLVLPQATTKSSPNRLQVKISDMAGKRCGFLVRISGGFWAGNLWH